MATVQRATTPQSVDELPIQSSLQLSRGSGTPIIPPQWTVFLHDLKLAYSLTGTLAVTALIASGDWRVSPEPLS